MWYWVRPARGWRTLARYRAVLYVGDPLEVTMGQRRTSGLWIFSCPMNMGQDELEGLRCRYSWMVRASLFLIDGMGYFLRGQYEPEDKMSLTLAVYCDRSMMTGGYGWSCRVEPKAPPWKGWASLASHASLCVTPRSSSPGCRLLLSCQGVAMLVLQTA